MKAGKPLRVLFATSECAPWAKVGGLGEISAALPPALRALGLDVRVLLPCYPSVRACARGARSIATLDAEFGLPAARLLRATLPGEVPALLLDCPALYMRDGGPYVDANGADYADNALRFGLLSRVAARLASAGSPLRWRADVLHCNDWPTGLAPLYLSGLPDPAGSVFSIHNLAFQGLFPLSEAGSLGIPAGALHSDGVEFWGRLSFMKAALRYAGRLCAVSPSYAREILDAEHGCGLEGVLRERSADLVGILNGIDSALWDPASDAHLARRYDARSLAGKRVNKRALQAEMGLQQNDDVLLCGMVTRLTDQKGVDLVLDALPALLERPLQIALLGTGDAALERAVADAAAAAPGRVAARIGFDEGLAHRIEAGADVFLMPSRFEPCGLNQMYSQRYGTPPIVRATGGLRDSVTDFNEAAVRGGEATGFVFDEASADALRGAIERALAVYGRTAVWRALCRNGMARAFGWDRPALAYRTLYASVRARR